MKTCFILVFILFSCIIGYSQVNTTSNITTETPNEYYLQVKQFSEFIDRFNYESDWKGNRISSDFAQKHPRKAYLSYLLNASDPRLSITSDSSYNKVCDTFFSEAVNPENPLHITLFSDQVTAKAKVSISYLGKDYGIVIYFTPEVLNDRSGKWTINKVEADCFNTMNDSLSSHFISPNSHETSFINLKRMEALSNPIFFMSTEIATDTTLQFMTEIAAGNLKIKNIEKVTYLINLSDWQITVDEFIRSNYNSGWLISNIEKL